MIKAKILFIIFLGLNAFHYPYLMGYNAKQHLEYARIISSQWRFPTVSESFENYNPPFFYLVAGGVGQIVSRLTGWDFYQSVNAYKIIGVALAVGAVIFWSKIFTFLQPKQFAVRNFFLILLFTLPVFHKVAVMFNTELMLMFFVSLLLWFLITHFLRQPNLKKLLVLSLLTSIVMLIRISGIIIFGAVILGLIGQLVLRQISLKRFLVFLAIFLAITISVTGWFYYGRRNEGIYQAGRIYKQNVPIWNRQPLDFYTYVPFKLMMTYPIRLTQPLNHLIPLYYSDFWGDWWNYFSQRRYGITLDQLLDSRHITSPPRVANLALQNQVNIPLTLLMMLGMLYLFWRIIKGSKKRNLTWLTESIFAVTFVVTWFGFMLMQVKYPNWKSDAVKPSYMLYLIPVFLYAATCFLWKVVRKKKYIFIPLIIWLFCSSLVNLYFDYF